MSIKRIRTRLGDLHVDVVGSGPPVMLWHSLFVDSREFDRVRGTLGHQRTLVLVDGPGHGWSGPPPEEFTLEDCAEAAAELQDELGLGAVDWVGSAWGGHVGIVLGVLEPRRVSSLVAIGTPLSPLTRGERTQIGALVQLYRRLGPIGMVTNSVEAGLLSPAVRKNDEEAVSLVRNAFSHAERTGMYRAMVNVMLRRPDISDRFRNLNVPTLLVTGTEDPLWTPVDALAAIRYNDWALAYTAKGAAHLPALEVPDRVANIILQFWRERLAWIGAELRTG